MLRILKFEFFWELSLTDLTKNNGDELKVLVSELHRRSLFPCFYLGSTQHFAKLFSNVLISVHVFRLQLVIFTFEIFP
jgi:hypothetical protein